MNPSETQYRFGDCVIDVATREIRRAGAPVEVQPRVFALLVYLLEHRARAVDKDELQDAVWPGRVITETALTRAVMKARKAVGDDASTQSVIKTLHGHGYRFVAALEGLSDEPPAPTGPEAGSVAPVAPTAGRGKRRKYLVGAVALVIALAGLWLLLLPASMVAGGHRIAVLPLVNATGDVELDWARLGLMSFAGSLFRTDGQLDLVADASVIELAENLGWSGDSADAADAAALVDKLRRVYGATHLLSMRLDASGATMRMSYTLLAPDDREHRGTMVGREATELVQGVVQSVYGHLRGRGRLGREAPAISDDPFINEAFARGMGLSREGRCAEANPLFRVIIDQQPYLEEPRHEYGSCLRILGESEAAEAVLTELVRDRRAEVRSRGLGETLMVLGVLYIRTGRPDQARPILTEALETSSAIGDHDLRARILTNLAILAKDLSDYEQAQDLLDRALLAFKDAGREVPPGELYSTMANLAMSRGELVQADNYLTRALAVFRDIGDRRHEAMMINNTGFLRRLQGRLDEAEMFHRQSLAIREEIGDRVGVGRIYNMLAILHTSRGEYDKARESALAALEISRETRDRLFEATAHAQLADAELRLDNVEQAERHYREGRAIFVEIQDRMRVLQSDIKLARLDLDAGRFDEAEQTATEVLEEARPAEIMQPEVQAMELIGDVALARGELGAAAVHYRQTLDRVRQTSWSAKESTILRKLADAHLDLGDVEAAEPLIGALTDHEPDVQSLKVQARFAFMRENPQKAVELMAQAKDKAGEHWADDSEATLREYQAALSTISGQQPPAG